METVFVFLANGFEEIEAFTAVDVLRRGGLDVQLVSMNSLVDSDTPECVIGAHDVEVVCDVLFAEADFTRAKALVLPGGMPGAEVLSKHNGLNELVTQFFKADKLVAAICAAPMVLGKLGLLQGRRSTCYPGFEQYLTGAICTGEQFTVDGNYISAIGPGGAMCFALAIVEHLLGLHQREELREAMCVK